MPKPTPWECLGISEIALSESEFFIWPGGRKSNEKYNWNSFLTFICSFSEEFQWQWWQTLNGNQENMLTPHSLDVASACKLQQSAFLSKCLIFPQEKPFAELYI